MRAFGWYLLGAAAGACAQHCAYVQLSHRRYRKAQAEREKADQELFERFGTANRLRSTS